MAKRVEEWEGVCKLYGQNISTLPRAKNVAPKNTLQQFWGEGETIIAEIFHTFFWVNHKMWIFIFNLLG